jgi:hypothetical protein
MNKASGSGQARTGADVNRSFSVSKAAWQSDVQAKLFFTEDKT